MKMLLLIVALSICVSHSAFAETSNEIVTRICDSLQRKTRHICFSSSYRFDHDSCLSRGNLAYAKGKLELAKTLCLAPPLNTDATGLVGRDMTLSCMEAVKGAEMPGDELFKEALATCSKLKEGLLETAKVGTRHSAYEQEAEDTAQAGVYSCLNALY